MPQQIIASLVEAHRLAPENKAVSDRLTGAYIRNGDWNAVAAMLREKPIDLRTTQDQVRLSKVLLKARKYEEASELTRALFEDGGNPNADVIWLAAASAFYNGESERAELILDEHWSGLVAGGYDDAFFVRAMIHFDKGELGAARGLLETLIQRKPRHVAGHLALGRVLMAEGRPDEARQRVESAKKLQSARAERIRRAMRLTVLLKAFPQALRAKDFDACERMLSEMLVIAPDQQTALAKYAARLRAARNSSESQESP